MKFCLFDASNLVHRAKHVVGKPKAPSIAHMEESTFSTDERVGMILHIMFNSLKRAYERFGAQHAVVCFDRRSWRREITETYKANRREVVRTPTEEAEHKMILETIDTVRDFFRDYTNVTVLEAQFVEADDFIARWIQLHEDEAFEHVIISTDTDFKQLVRPGVELFSPMQSTLYTCDGVFYQDGKKPKKEEVTVEKYGETWKIKVDKQGDAVKFDPKWELFEKCIRGDTSDNIPSAWPGVRTVAMEKAFYGDALAWNNFINSTWGGEDNPTSVKQRYEENKLLIDLTMQPEPVKELIDETIADAVERPRKPLVGAYFTKFCAKYGLMSLLGRADSIGRILNSSYNS